MIETTWKKRAAAPVGEVLAALLLVQPLLDVFSYFIGLADATWITTALRTFLLVAVCVYGFALTENRRVYYGMAGIVGGFWVLHALNCLRLGYQDPVGDAAEYLKLVQFPLWALSFITFFRQKEKLNTQVIGMLAVNFGTILGIIALSYGVGHPVYTYEYPDRGVFIGVLGWFGVANSQSCILTLLLPPLLLWGLRTGKLWLFSLCCVGGFGLLYLTGTRLTYYGALLIGAGFLVLLLLRRRQLLFCIPLGIAVVALLLCRDFSPMAERQALTGNSYSVYQEKTEEIMGEDTGYVPKEGEEIPPEILEKITRVYTEIYNQPGVYGEVLLADLIDQFGLEIVMEQYNYSTDPADLQNGRNIKLNFMELMWNRQDFLTQVFGMEYANCWVGNVTYDPENDCLPVLYYYGYLGALLYAGFIVYFVGTSLKALCKDWRTVISVEFATPVMMLGMMLGAAQLSGNVFRRPSVTVYGSVAAALLFVWLHPSGKENMGRNRAGGIWWKKKKTGGNGL